MTRSRIYLDHAATTPLSSSAKEKMIEVMDRFGNPSSLHEHGRMAKHEIDWAREQISSALGCLFAEVVFTGSGTEAANLAIIGCALANEDSNRKRILLSSIEHHCVLNTQPILERLGYQAELIPVDRESRVHLQKLDQMLSEDVLLVSVMSVNNETGMKQKISDIAAMTHRVGATLHCDHVQGFMKLGDAKVVQADLVSIAGHKVNGPKGVGALAVMNGTKIKPLLTGGEQERELRGGTENLLGIVGFGAAVNQYEQMELWPMQVELMDILKSAGAVPTVENHLQTLDSHVHVRFPGIDAETLLIRLDREGISASSGAACSSGSVEPSHVMLACGYSEEQAKEGVRFSLGLGNNLEEIQRAGEIIVSVVEEIRRRRGNK
jgi:cysteine desulfurase